MGIARKIPRVWQFAKTTAKRQKGFSGESERTTSIERREEENP
jgi:hypothetical protein